MTGLCVSRDEVAGRPVRSWSAGTADRLPPVVFVPGLGAPGYLLRWARSVSGWTRASVLDVPGWRWGRARACPPTLAGVAAATTAWLDAMTTEPVVLVGHSTGSQAVAHAAVQRPDLVAGVVLVGPTFDPAVRTAGAVVRAAARTLVHERPGEVPAVIGSYMHSGVVPLLRFLHAGLTDRPEQTITQIAAPVLVMTGEHDGFAPPAWAHRVADVVGAPAVVAPGAHNFCFPHPDVADATLRRVVTDWAVGRRPGAA